MKITFEECLYDITLDIDGHAHADENGNQVPCAKVTILSQTLALRISQFVPENLIEYSGSQGHFHLKVNLIPMELREAQRIRNEYAFCLSGLRLTLKQHPGIFTLNVVHA